MKPRSPDTLIVAGLCVAIGVIGFAASANLHPAFFDQATGNDVWFEADLARVADEMTHRYAQHSRATVHPLFSLLTVSVAYALRFLGAPPHLAVAGIVGFAAAAWAAACYALFRALCISRADSILLVLLTASSAAGQFWLTVPESATLGSASVMGALAVAAYAMRRSVPDWWFVAASAGSLAITVSNWIAGIAGAVAALPLRRAASVVGNGLAIVVVLWTVQRAVVPYGDFFIGYSNEQRYLLRAETGGVLNALRVATVNGMLMPALELREKPGREPIMTVQRNGLAQHTRLALVGVWLWAILSAWGVLAVVRRWKDAAGYRPVLAVLAFELSLYGVYGTETFLYVLNIIPLVVAIVGGGLTAMSGHQSRAAGRVVRMGTVALLMIALINNTTRLREARAYFTPAVAARIASMLAPTSVPSSAAFR